MKQILIALALIFAAGCIPSDFSVVEGIIKQIQFTTGCADPTVYKVGDAWWGVDACGQKFLCCNTLPRRVSVFCYEVVAGDDMNALMNGR